MKFYHPDCICNLHFFFLYEIIICYLNKFCIDANEGMLGEIESKYAYGVQTSGSEKAALC